MTNLAPLYRWVMLFRRKFVFIGVISILGLLKRQKTNPPVSFRQWYVQQYHGDIPKIHTAMKGTVLIFKHILRCRTYLAMSSTASPSRLPSVAISIARFNRTGSLSLRGNSRNTFRCHRSASLAWDLDQSTDTTFLADMRMHFNSMLYLFVPIASFGRGESLLVALLCFCFLFE